MIFDNNEIINAADRFAIDEWCSMHVMGYIPINNINEFLDTGQLSYLHEPVTLSLCIGNEKSAKYTRTYPAVFLNKSNELVLCNDMYQNILIYNDNDIPEFVKFKKYTRLKIDFNDKLKTQYNVAVERTLNFYINSKYVVMDSILKEYKNSKFLLNI